MGRYGLVKLEQNAGLMIIGDTGRLVIGKASEASISKRNSNYAPIVPTNLDYAIKVGLADGNEEAWTNEERLAALLRMGCTVDENGFVKFTKTT